MKRFSYARYLIWCEVHNEKPDQDLKALDQFVASKQIVYRFTEYGKPAEVSIEYEIDRHIMRPEWLEDVKIGRVML